VGAPADDELDVRAAAKLAGRTAETIRRWVWSGRLKAHKRGNRLMVRRADVVDLSGGGARVPRLSLEEWARASQAALQETPGPYSSASDLVLTARARHTEEASLNSGS
jgi:excisionase family DNA binding protein